MYSTSLKAIAKQYFSIFSKKDLSGLAKLFSDDVCLRDWEIAASGKEAVLNANQKIFEALKTIEVTPVLLLAENDWVSAQLEILVNKEEVIHVVDLLRFNSEQKISHIIAFKG
jgi:hypothetical protein